MTSGPGVIGGEGSLAAAAPGGAGGGDSTANADEDDYDYNHEDDEDEEEEEVVMDEEEMLQMLDQVEFFCVFSGTYGVYNIYMAAAAEHLCTYPH